jgi:hypothetical protein
VHVRIAGQIAEQSQLEEAYRIFLAMIIPLPGLDASEPALDSAQKAPRQY